MNSYSEGHRRIEGRVGRLSLFSAVCIAVILSAVSARAATFTVGSTADSGAGSLRDTLAAATNGDIINFFLQNPATITLTSGALTVTQSVTIAGPGPASLAIDGNSSSGVFAVSGGGSVAISGLTVTNGHASVGGILENASQLTLSNIVVTGNYGGGILAQGGALSLINCTVTGNNSGTNGSGGGIACEDFYTQRVQIVSSIISGNTAARGGGLYVADTGGPLPVNTLLAMTNTTVSGNVAATYGGGMYVSPMGSVFTMPFSNVIFSNNSAQQGGGIYALKASGLNLANLSLIGNFASRVGGGLGVAGCLPVLSNATFIANSAVYDGGAVCNEAGGDSTFAGLVLYNSVVVSNYASNGGAVFGSSDTYGVSAQIFNSTVAYNVATNAGGAICNSINGGGGYVEIVGSTFSGNSAAIGGAVYNYGEPFFDYQSSASVGITNSTFSGNTAGTGGAIYNIYFYPTNNLDNEPSNGVSTVQIFNSTFSGNSATNGGGGIFNTFSNAGNALVQIGSSILNAGTSGGTISNTAGTIVSLGYNLSSDTAAGALTNSTDLINIDPKLGPLQDNGGGVLTHALLPDSPAIDKGYNFSGYANDGNAWDERGPRFVRRYDYPSVPNAVGGDGTDIGAFELQTTFDPFVIWQFQNFGCTNCPQGAPTADPDGDGADNMAEYLAGTNPNSSASALRVLNVKRQGNDLLVTWQTAGGHTNVLQSSASLGAGSFSDISSNIVVPGIGDTMASILEAGAAQNGTNSFFRVRLAQ